MITLLLNGMISLINMTYHRVRETPELKDYDKLLLQHLIDKGQCCNLCHRPSLPTKGGLSSQDVPSPPEPHKRCSFSS